MSEQKPDYGCAEKSNYAGICPNCGVDGRLNYGCAEITDGSVDYPYECDACHFKGHEYYILRFDTHTDNSGHEPHYKLFNTE